jgi:hypothetical protein
LGQNGLHKLLPSNLASLVPQYRLASFVILDCLLHFALDLTLDVNLRVQLRDSGMSLCSLASLRSVWFLPVLNDPGPLNGQPVTAGLRQARAWLRHSDYVSRALPAQTAKLTDVFPA